ncbi:MAG: pectin acetylesterase-family hydrolase, partial [Woeseiaceae bacterium]
MRTTFLLLSLSVLSFVTAAAQADKGGVYPRGLNPQAEQELKDANLDKYVGQFSPAFSYPVGEGWTKHVFDPGAAFDGPVCVAGTPFSAFTKQGNPAKLLIMLQGGGACWQDFYSCNVLAEDQEPPPPQVGIWDEQSGLNPIDDWSVVYLPYCDGSVFTGDNDVIDPAWQAFIEGALGLPPGAGPLVRFHRGLRNVTAGIDLAKDAFPHASRILVAGSSAGGVGAT